MTAVVAQIPLFYGAAEKNRILQHMRENHSIYLSALRSFARVYAMQHGTVTIDDVRRIIKERDFPMPGDIGVTNRVFGTVFNKAFEPVNQCLSTREERIKRSGANSSFITIYKLREAV